MSVRVLSLVWDGYEGGGSELLALLAMADWSDDEGVCWPSMASVGRKTRLSEKQARRVVHGLIQSGHLAVLGNADGGATSRRYQIKLARLTPPAGVSPPTHGSPPAHVRNPSQPREATPPTHGSRTVIDTLVNRQGEKSTRTASKKTCPDDFQVSESMKEWATSKGFPTDRLESETDRFLDWHRSKGNRFADWTAAWRNWITKSQDFERTRNSADQTSPFAGAL